MHIIDVNKLVLAPSEFHLLAAKILLTAALFAAGMYISFAVGCVLWSVFFSVLDWDSRNANYRRISRYLIELATANKPLAVYLGVLPLAAGAILYAQIHYQTLELTKVERGQVTAPLIAASVIVCAAGLLFMFLYRTAFKLRENHFFYHITPGVVSLGLLMTGWFVASTGITLSMDAEKWPILLDAQSVFLASWNNITHLLVFLTGVLLITGSAVLFFFFTGDNCERDGDPQYAAFVRSFSSGLTLAAGLILPIVLLWDTITLPEVALSTLFYISLLLAVSLTACAARAAFSVIIVSPRNSTVRPFMYVLTLFAVLGAAGHLNRESALRDHSDVLVARAEAEQAKMEAMLAEAKTGGEPGAAGGTGPATPARGQELMKMNACLSCHSVDGSRLVGPSYKGLYGSKVTVVTNGQERVTTADDAYIKNSMLEPNADIVKGYQPQMPSQKGKLSDSDINAIIAYLKTLK